jgi:hypothetical protein
MNAMNFVFCEKREAEVGVGKCTLGVEHKCLTLSFTPFVFGTYSLVRLARLVRKARKAVKR